MLNNAAVCEALLGVPQRRRLLETYGLDIANATVAAHGYWKLALIWPDQVLLLPRVAEAARGLTREAAVLQFLAQSGVHESMAQIIKGPFRDAKLWPLPMMIVSRLSGTPLWQQMGNISADDLAIILTDLGRQMAVWHRLDPADLPPALQKAVRRKSGPILSHQPWVDLATSPTGRAVAVQYAVRRLRAKPQLSGIADLETRWLRGLRPLARLRPCLIHADLHEAQILVSGQHVTGVFDWESACIRHPAMEFDLNEWDKTLWGRFLPDFNRLRAAWWQGYAGARGLDPDPNPINLFHLMWRSLCEPSARFIEPLAQLTRTM